MHQHEITVRTLKAHVPYSAACDAPYACSTTSTVTDICVFFTFTITAEAQHGHDGGACAASVPQHTETDAVTSAGHRQNAVNRLWHAQNITPAPFGIAMLKSSVPSLTTVSGTSSEQRAKQGSRARTAPQVYSAAPRNRSKNSVQLCVRCRHSNGKQGGPGDVRCWGCKACVHLRGLRRPAAGRGPRLAAWRGG